MELKNKKVIIIGAGKSGIAASEMLDELGASTLLFDQNEKLDTDALKQKLPANLL